MSAQPQIVGGGLAGGMTAYSLAKFGHKPILFERTATPGPKVCGEFLSAEAIEVLNGVLPGGLRKFNAPVIDKARFSCNQTIVEFDLPRACVGVGRKELDEALLDAAQSAGATILRGTLIRSADDLDHCAPIVLATGKLNFPGARRPLQKRQSTLVGLKQHYKPSVSLPAALKSKIHLFFFEGGYGGLVAINDRRISLAMAVEKSCLNAAGGTLDGLMRYAQLQDSSLGQWMDHMVPVGEPLAIGQVPYGYVAKQPLLPGSYGVGDQAAVIPSFSGDGMAIALMTGQWAASAVHQRLDPVVYHKKMSARLFRNVRSAHFFSPIIANPQILEPAMQLLKIKGMAKLLFIMTRTPRTI